MDTDRIRPPQTARSHKAKELITLLEVSHQDMFGRELRRQGMRYLNQVATQDGLHLRAWHELATTQQQTQLKPNHRGTPCWWTRCAQTRIATAFMTI